MIGDFLSSWGLFQNTYLAGWLIAVLLSFVGVFVVARDQVFLGAAVSQSSTFGIAFALWLEARLALTELAWFSSAAFHTLLGGAFSVLAALTTARSSQLHRESHEATTGWVFLFTGSGAVLLVAHSPHGLEEVQRLIGSTIIGATLTDVAVFAVATIVTVGIFVAAHRELCLLMLDPEMAGAVGLRARAWEGAIYGWLGLVLGLSIHVSGMVYAFGCLVLPALVAKNFCRDITSTFCAAPIVALTCSVAAFVLANHYDYPPGQLTVALLSILLLFARVVRRLEGPWRRFRSGAGEAS